MVSLFPVMATEMVFLMITLTEASLIARSNLLRKRKRRNAWIAVGAGATGTAIAAAAVFLSSKKELTYRDSNGNLNTICTPRGKQMAWKFINTVSSLGIGVRNEFKNAIHDGPNRPDSNYLI